MNLLGRSLAKAEKEIHLKPSAKADGNEVEIVGDKLGWFENIERQCERIGV